MTEFAELERRITAALGRIGAGVDGLAVSAAGQGGAEASLREALATEQEANAQLQERVKALHRQQDSRVKELEGELSDLRDVARTASQQIQQLREANQQLQASLQSLREAQSDAIAEPHLINQAMMSEIEGLRATREGDRAEMDEILGRLKPLLREENNA